MVRFFNKEIPNTLAFNSDREKSHPIPPFTRFIRIAKKELEENGRTFAFTIEQAKAIKTDDNEIIKVTDGYYVVKKY